MTQKELILEHLRQHANEWVTGQSIVDAGGSWRYGARLYELRAQGHQIEHRPSERSAVHEYRLVVAEVAPGQIPLFGEAA